MERPQDVPAAAVAAAPEVLDGTREAYEARLKHLRNAPKFDLRDRYELGSTTPEELAERIRDLEYRLRWLDSLTSATNEELVNCKLALEKHVPAGKPKKSAPDAAD